MKLAHVIQAVYFQRWAITDAGWFAVHDILQAHLNHEDKATARLTASGSIDEETDIEGNPIQQYENVDGVAIIPVKGTLIHHASLMDKQCGACSYDDIKRDVVRAMSENVGKIVLDVDSPGGMVMGLEEACAVIAEARESGIEVEAVTDSLMCSAGYRLSIEADAIYATPSSIVGSVGVITAYMDQSERYKMAGVKPVLFTSGDLKGTGFPGTSLSDAQSEHIKSDVAHLFGIFKNAVKARRPLVEDDSMRGQAFSGDVAESRGLIGFTIRDIEERFEL